MSLPDKKDICEKIVKIASNSGSYIEAVVHVADQENIEVESIAKFLTKPLRPLKLIIHWPRLKPMCQVESALLHD